MLLLLNILYMLKPASWGKLAEAHPGEDKIKDHHLQHNASADRATHRLHNGPTAAAAAAAASSPLI